MTPWGGLASVGTLVFLTAQTSWAAPNQLTLMFLGGPSEISVNSCALINVRTTNTGMPDANHSGYTVSLFDENKGGIFYSNSVCSNQVSQINIAALTHTATFYYKKATPADLMMSVDDGPGGLNYGFQMLQVKGPPAKWLIDFGYGGGGGGPAATLQTNTCSSPYSIRLVDSLNHSTAPLVSNYGLVVTDNNADVTLYNDMNCSTPWNGLATIDPNMPTVNFRIKKIGTTAATVIVAARASLDDIASSSKSINIVGAASKLGIEGMTFPGTNMCSSLMIKTKDSLNNPSNVTTDTTISLADGGDANGNFYGSMDSMCSNAPVANVTINNGMGMANFYYKKTNEGNVTLTASAGGFTDGTKVLSVGGQPSCYGGSNTFTVSGTVNDSGGPGLSNVRIKLSRAGCQYQNPPSPFFEGTTDANGAFSIAGVTTGTFFVEYFKYGYTFFPNFLGADVLANTALQTAIGNTYGNGPGTIQPNNLYNFIQTSATLIGGTTMNLFISTSAAPMDFGGIKFTLPPDLNMAIANDGNNLLMRSTFSAPVAFGAMTCLWPPNMDMTVTTTTAGGYIYKSTSSDASMAMSGGINFKLPQSMDTIVQQNAGNNSLFMQTTGVALISYGNNLNIKTPPGSPVNITTSAAIPNGWLFNSTASAAGIQFGGGKIKMELAPGFDTMIKESVTGILMYTTAPALTNWGNNLKVQTPGSGIEVSMSTTNTYFPSGWTYQSTGTAKIQLGNNLPIGLPADTKIDYQENPDGAVFTSTGLAYLNPGDGDMSIKLAGGYEFNVGTSAFFSGGSIYTSTVSVPIAAEGGAISVMTNPGMPLNVQQQPDGLIMIATGASSFGYGNNMTLNLPANIKLDIATTSIVANAQVYESSVPVEIQGGNGQLSIKTNSFMPLYIKEGSLVVASTGPASFVLEGDTSLKLNGSAQQVSMTTSAVLSGADVFTSTAPSAIQAEASAITVMTNPAMPLSIKTDSDGLVLVATGAAKVTMAEGDDLAVDITKGVQLDISTSSVLAGAQTYRSTKSIKIQDEGGVINIDTRFSQALLHVKNDSAGMVMVQTSAVMAAYGLGGDMQVDTLLAGVNLALSTSAALAGGVTYQSSMTMIISGENSRILTGTNPSMPLSIKEDAGGLVLMSTGSAAFSLNEGSSMKTTLNANQKLGVSTSAVISNQYALLLESTAPTKVAIGNDDIAFMTNPAMPLNILEKNSNSILLVTTGTAKVTFGDDMGVDVSTGIELNVGVSPAAILNGGSVYISTEATKIEAEGGAFSVMTNPSIPLNIKQNPDGVALVSTVTTSLSLNANMALFLNQGQKLDVSTSAVMAGAQSYQSTAPTKIQAGGGALNVMTNPAMPFSIKENADGLTMMSTGAASFSLGGDMAATLGSAQKLEIATSTALGAGTQVMESTAPMAITGEGGAITVQTNPSMPLNVKSEADGLVIMSTGPASFGLGGDMAAALAQGQKLEIATSAALGAGTQVMESTAPMKISAEGGIINIMTNPAMPLNIKSDSDGMMLLSTAAAKFTFGETNSLALNLPANTQVDIATSAALSGGSVIQSAASMTLDIGAGAITLPPVAVNLKEDAPGEVLAKSTSAGTQLQWSGGINIDLPVNISAKMISQSSISFSLNSTANVAVSNGGISVVPPSGTVTTTSYDNKFAISVPSTSKADVDLFLPTTAQKTIEVALNPANSSGTAKIEMAPGSLSQNVSLEIKQPSAIINTGTSQSGALMSAVGVGLEINPSSPVNLSTTGVVITMTVPPGTSTSSLKISRLDENTGKWVIYNTTINGSTLTATIDHFSLYQVMAVGDKFAFLNTSPNGITGGSCSQAFTIQTQDSGGSPKPVGSNTLLPLSDNGGGTFYMDPGCLYNISQATISTGTSMVSFYYKRSSVTVLTSGNITVATVGDFLTATKGFAVYPLQQQGGGGVATQLLLGGPSTVPENTCSATFQTNSADNSSILTNVTSTTTVNLSDGGMGGVFYSDAACTATISQVAIASGTNSKSFFYKKASPGSVTISITATGLMASPKYINVGGSVPQGSQPCPVPGTDNFIVNGYVQNNQNQALSGVNVKLEREGCYGGSVYSTMTVTGNYNFPAVSTGSYKLVLLQMGTQFTPNFVPVNVTTANVSLSTITGVSFSSGGFQLNQIYDFVQSSYTLIGGTTMQQYVSPSSVALDFSGISVGLKPNVSVNITSIGDNLVVVSTYQAPITLGGYLDFNLPPNIQVNISSSAGAPPGTNIYQSSFAVPVSFGNNFAFKLPPSIDTHITASSGGGLIFNTTSQAVMDYGTNLKLTLPPGGFVNITTTAALGDGAWIFRSTVTQTPLSFADNRIKISMPQGFESIVKENLNGLAFKASSAAATFGYGDNIKFQLPPSVDMTVSTTQTVFANGWVARSTSSNVAIQVSSGLAVRLPPNIDTFFEERLDRTVMKATASTNLGLGTGLQVALPPSVQLDIGAASAFGNSGGSILLSTATLSMSIGNGTFTIPPALGFDFASKADSKIIMRSTAALPIIQWGGEVNIHLPSGIPSDFFAKSNTNFVLTSTASIPIASGGMTFVPSSGTIETNNLPNLFSMSMATDSTRLATLTLPTTAQKPVELQLARGVSNSSGTKVSIQIEPNALSANVNLDISMASNVPTATQSTTGGTVAPLGSEMAIEINPSVGISVTNSTGVPITFGYSDADLGSKSTDSLKVCVYSAATAKWEVLPTIINIASKTITAYAPHFSLYQAMSVDAAPASVGGSSTTTTIDHTVSTSVVYNAPKGAVTVDIPANAFSQAVTVAVSTPSSYPSATSPGATLEGVGAGVEITVTNNLQPEKEVTLAITYASGDETGHQPTQFVIARYDTINNVWVPLPSTVDTASRKVTATTKHFSIFQIMQVTPAASAGEAKVFPNPFRPSMGHSKITFSNMPASSTIKIFTINGNLVKELTGDVSGIVSWDGKNDAGENVASGVYFAFIEGPGGNKTLKVAIER